MLEAAEATLALTYPLDIAATRSIRPADGKAFTREELVRLIDETYREVYRLETDLQSSPTPPIHERGQLINRPRSDGIFGIWGHDLDDLGIAEIKSIGLAGAFGWTRIWLVRHRLEISEPDGAGILAGQRLDGAMNRGNLPSPQSLSPWERERRGAPVRRSFPHGKGLRSSR